VIAVDGNHAVKPWNDATVASNGRPVRENFADWFGHSKVVGEDGVPLVVFHGTSVVFEQFDLAKVGRNGAHRREEGIFFTDSPSLAMNYAWSSAKRQRADAIGSHNLPKCLQPWGDAEAAPFLMPLYVRLTNPRILDMKGSSAVPSRTYQAIERARAVGQDGVIIINVDDNTYGKKCHHSGSDTIYVAFAPEQVKSALGNSGLYLDSPSLCDDVADTEIEAELERPRMRA
jgi:hypothetical protein